MIKRLKISLKKAQGFFVWFVFFCNMNLLAFKVCYSGPFAFHACLLLCIIQKLFCFKHEKVATFLQFSFSQNDESKVLLSKCLSLLFCSCKAAPGGGLKYIQVLMTNKSTIWKEINGQSLAIVEVSTRRCRITTVIRLQQIWDFTRNPRHKALVQLYLFVSKQSGYMPIILYSFSARKTLQWAGNKVEFFWLRDEICEKVQEEENKAIL